MREHVDEIENVVRMVNENAMIEKQPRAKRREPFLAQQMLGDLTGAMFTGYRYRSQWAHNKRHTEAEIARELDHQHIDNLDSAEAALALMEESGSHCTEHNRNVTRWSLHGPSAIGATGGQVGAVCGGFFGGVR
eukprot:COSAG02_NODE_8256_length_2639_cov_2.416142_1_plen_134_part_00